MIAEQMEELNQRLTAMEHHAAHLERELLARPTASDVLILQRKIDELEGGHSSGGTGNLFRPRDLIPTTWGGPSDPMSFAEHTFKVELFAMSISRTAQEVLIALAGMREYSRRDLELALDNLVAAYACFWPGDRSMVTLRRVVTKTKSFSAIPNPDSRMKMMEIFINQILEIKDCSL